MLACNHATKAITGEHMSNELSNEKLAYRVNDLPRILGIGRNAAYALCKRPDFPSVKIGNSIIIPVDALNKCLATQLAQGDNQQGSAPE